MHFVHNDQISTSEELLAKDKTETTQVRSLHLLGTEIYKVKSHLPSLNVQQRFGERSLRYNFRHQTDFSLETTTTFQLGINSLRYVGTKIWSLFRRTLQNCENRRLLKDEIRNCIPNIFSCSILCVLYVKLRFPENHEKSRFVEPSSINMFNSFIGYYFPH